MEYKVPALHENEVSNNLKINTYNLQMSQDPSQGHHGSMPPPSSGQQYPPSGYPPYQGYPPPPQQNPSSHYPAPGQGPYAPPSHPPPPPASQGSYSASPYPPPGQAPYPPPSNSPSGPSIYPPPSHPPPGQASYPPPHPPPAQGAYPPPSYPPPNQSPYPPPNQSPYPPPQHPPSVPGSATFSYPPPPTQAPGNAAYGVQYPPATPMTSMPTPVPSAGPTTMPSGTAPVAAPAAPCPPPDHDAKIIRDACKGIGCDERAIINVIANRTPQQNQAIAEAYRRLFAKDLIKVLESELRDPLERAILGLFLEPMAYDAREIFNACKGFGTNEAALIEILALRSNNEIRHLTALLKTSHSKDLSKLMKSELSGKLEDMFLALAKAERDERPVPDPQHVNTDVENLYRAAQGFILNETPFIVVFAHRSEAQLRAIFQEYKRKYGKDLYEVIDKKFSGHLRKTLLTIHSLVQSRPEAVATQIEETMKGVSYRESNLARVLTRHRYLLDPAFLAQVKVAYKKLYGKELRRRICEQTEGHMRTLYLTLLNEPIS
ncbi:uncharacterized protein VTP21DRAFT_4679 [Calcarisporiella thermophila]|uniref:uncharacterized protein n=1 Tax=Calcarisporiella thermophila TaxID=911321 RepID=UPI00374223EE